MPKKGRGPKEEPPELWVAPQYSLKGPRGERAWENRSGGPPSNSRYLELADIALGLKKSAHRRLRPATTHDSLKKEPYLPPK